MNNTIRYRILPVCVLLVLGLAIARPDFVQGKASPKSTPTPTPTRTSAPTLAPTLTPTGVPPANEVVDPADVSTLPAGTNVLIDFNNFTNPVDGQAVPTSYAGMAWNSLVEGSPWAGIASWNFYISSGILQGTITFPRTVVVNSLRVSSGSTNTITLSSAGNPDASVTTTGSSPQTLSTGWTNPVTSLTVRSSTKDQALDDLRLTTSGGAANPTSTPAVTSTSAPTLTRTPAASPTASATLPAASTPTNTPAPTNTLGPSATPASGGTVKVADHTTLSQFASIPQAYVQAAAAKKTLFMHQSTGGYIDDYGLNCLAGLRPFDGYPTECYTYASNLPNGFPLYPRSNWAWNFWPTPMADSMAKVDQYISLMTPSTVNGYDVLGMKFCYTDGWNQDNNVSWTNPSDPTRPAGYYINKMLDLEAQYPGKIFIWSTSPLWNDPGTACDPTNPFNSCAQIADFNAQVRAYATNPSHPKPLYDIADIESHDDAGNPCTVAGFEGLCSVWYDNSGGHPNIAGAIRLAKGFWWLMARVSGWNGTPGSTPVPSSTPTSTPVSGSTPAPSATPTASPSEVVDPANISSLAAGTNVLIDFNNLASPSDGQPVPAGYAGITWNTLVEGAPWAGDSTWNIYVTNGGAQATITFPRPVIVKSVLVSSVGSNQFTLSSTGNPDAALTTSGNTPQTLTTSWVNPVTSLTLRTSNSDQVIDDMRITIGN